MAGTKRKVGEVEVTVKTPEKRARKNGAQSYSTTAKTGKTANSGLAAYVRAMRPGESKSFDTLQAAVTLTTPSTPTPACMQSLVLIPQNNTQYGRIGRKIHLTSVEVRGAIYNKTTTSDTGLTRVRAMLVLDRQANGAMPTFSSSVGVNPAGPGGSDIIQTQAVDSCRLLDNVERFSILWDHMMDLRAFTSVNSEGYVHSFRKVKNLNHDVDYSNTTGVITTIRSNNLIFLIVTENLAGGGNVEGAFIARVRYTDQ